MARPEKPIDYTVPEVGRLATHLRWLRNGSGLTYAELAEHTLCSEATLKRAARGGQREPSWETVREFTLACGGDEDLVRRMYESAREAATIARRNSRRSSIVPKPQFVRDEGDLAGAMRDAYRRAGSPSVHEMERLTSNGRLPSSTAHAIVKGRAVPRDVRTYIAFLEMCEITDRSLIPWFAAWVKVRGNEKGVHGQRVHSVPTSLPAEKLFIEWCKDTARQTAPPTEEAPSPFVITDGQYQLVVHNGQHRIAALADPLQRTGGDVDIAA